MLTDTGSFLFILCLLHCLSDSTQLVPKLYESSFDFYVVGSGIFPCASCQDCPLSSTASQHICKYSRSFSPFVNIYHVLRLFHRGMAWQGANSYFTKFTLLKYLCFNASSSQACNPFLCIIFTCEWMLVYYLWLKTALGLNLYLLFSLFRDYIFPWIGEPGGRRLFTNGVLSPSPFYKGQTSRDLPALERNVQHGCAFCSAHLRTSQRLHEGVCTFLNDGGWNPWNGVHPPSFPPFN